MSAPKDLEKRELWIKRFIEAKKNSNKSYKSKGRKRPEITGNKHPFFGKKRPELNENKFSWNGGDKNWWSRYYRKLIKYCEMCKSINSIELHHKNKDVNNNKRFNCIILCRKCHQFWHHSE